MLPVIARRLFAKLPRNMLANTTTNTQARFASIITYKPQTLHNNSSIIRCKSKTSKHRPQQDESDTEQDSPEEEEIADKASKIMNLNVGSMRLDGILKSGLGIARNKIDAMFYESKIRLNGEKVLKKSAGVHVGDEIDVIKGVSTQNPKFLTVSRVEVLNTTARDDHISVKIRRCKSLIVENYEDPWKQS